MVSTTLYRSRECVVAQTSVSCQCKSSRGTGTVKVISSQLSFGSLTSIYGFILSNNPLSRGAPLGPLALCQSVPVQCNRPARCIKRIP